MNITAFDFKRKTEATLTREALFAEVNTAFHYWIELDHSDEGDVPAVLALFGINPTASAAFLGPDQDGRYDVYDDCLHVSLAEACVEDGRLAVAHGDMLLTDRCMLLWHRKPLPLLQHVRRTYREDFRRFAKTSGFLVYEIFDHLVESYRRSFTFFSNEVESVQLNLFAAVDDSIFLRVSGLTTDLLGFRKTVLASRELVHQLASRRSPFISEATQAFLAGMAGKLDRMSDDIISEREVLNETLNLYMGMVSHRTNRIINRLTVLSMIFLPLTFVCGVYGMNFDVMPELNWVYSYPIFWMVCLVFISISVYTMHKRRWI